MLDQRHQRGDSPGPDSDISLEEILRLRLFRHLLFLDGLLELVGRVAVGVLTNFKVQLVADFEHVVDAAAHLPAAVRVTIERVVGISRR
jgi:hypothetical protein